MYTVSICWYKLVMFVLCDSVCTVREDCYAPEHPELDCVDDQRHCYDSACICSVFGGGGSIGGGFPGGDWP